MFRALYKPHLRLTTKMDHQKMFHAKRKKLQLIENGEYT